MSDKSAADFSDVARQNAPRSGVGGNSHDWGVPLIFGDPKNELLGVARGALLLANLDEENIKWRLRSIRLIHFQKWMTSPGEEIKSKLLSLPGPDWDQTFTTDGAERTPKKGTV